MDILIAAAARALAAGDPLDALNRIATRADAPALALRGIALAQLGDLARARRLVRSAARAFGTAQPAARARCVVAEAEIALAARELAFPAQRLEAARAVLEERGDRLNAAHARALEARHLLLLGRLEEAERALAEIAQASLPPAARAIHELISAGIALRRQQAGVAQAALLRAERAAQRAGIAALAVEVQRAVLALRAPAARLLTRGEQRLVPLREIEALLASGALVVDARRHTVCRARSTISLARRPVLFALARTLAEAWPTDAARAVLIARAFSARRADDSHRARLRVEISRLRAALRPLASLTATQQGFALAPRVAREVAVLEPTAGDEHAVLLALLADSEPWSSSALALALGVSQRSAQRALEALAATGRVQPLGRGRSRRWALPPVPGFGATLLPIAPQTD